MNRSMTEKRGMSPSLPRKPESKQPKRSSNPSSIVERKKASTLTESRKLVPTRPKPFITSLTLRTSTRDPIKKSFVDKIKPRRRSLGKTTLPPFKVTSTKSIPNYISVPTSSTKIVGLTKPIDSRKPRVPLLSKNFVNVKQTSVGGKKKRSQPTKGFINKEMTVGKKPRSLPKEDRNILIHKEDDKIIDNDILISKGFNKSHLVDDKYYNDILLHYKMEFEDDTKTSLGEAFDQVCHEGNVIIDGSVDDEHKDRTNEINHVVNDHLSHFNGDQEVENERVVQGVVELESNALEHEHTKEKEDDQEHEETKLEELEDEETELGESEDEEIELNEVEHEETTSSEEDDDEEIKQEDLEIEEKGGEVPKKEEASSTTMVENQQVVVHGKKETATYNDVIEKTVNKHREQRINRVKALVGAFETLISSKSHVLHKR